MTSAPSGFTVSLIGSTSFFSGLLASPPPIGSSIPNSGAFTFFNFASVNANARTISSAPARGNPNSITTAFTGNLTNVSGAAAQIITGVATLGQPASGYFNNPETSVYYTYLTNFSGWNQSTSSNSGRTSTAPFFTKVDNYGQGDVMAFLSYGFVSGSRADATSWLANPAVSLYVGQVDAGSNGVYLNPRETQLNDNGFDVAAIGDVVNLNRTNATGALGTTWIGYRVQSIGTQPVDAAFSASGAFTLGLDLTTATTTAAITLAQGQRIYLGATNSGGFPNGTNPTGAYLIEIGGIASIVNGGVLLEVSTGQVTATAPLVSTANLSATWLGLTAPSTVNGAAYSVSASDSSLIFTTTNCTLTLPAASSNSGRILHLKNITGNSVTSASSNVVPLSSATPGTAILAASAGKYAMLQSDGTNWITMLSN